MQVIDINNKKYPKFLKETGKDAPKQLYYKESWKPDIFENCLAVVGSRRMTAYGRQVAEKLVGEAASAGLTIVSGFMYGVDAVSHKAALSVGGRTIAVMPCGIDLIHPAYQQDLYFGILNNNGLVISEYEGKRQPEIWTYPRRNRIVAGLSRAVLIIEAGEKSGSLITAEFAKKYKRKIFVVPGPITSENSKGIMKLIKQGAEPINSASDIINFYKASSDFALPLGWACASPGEAQAQNSTERKISDKLRAEAMNIDELANFLKISAAELGTILSIMQLQGLIKEEGGKFYPV
jgi:DNA processing protein